MIVFITIPWFSPAFRAGGPIQSIANLVNTYTEGITYKIFCGDTDLNDVPLTHIETGKWVKYNEQTEVWYAVKPNRSKTLTEQVEKVKPDIIFAVGLYSWYFTMVPLLFCKTPKKIFSVRGMLHPGALSQKKWKKQLFLRAFMLSGLHRRIAFHATDETEAGYIRSVFGEEGLAIHIAGNFARQIGWKQPIAKEPGALKLITIALISPMKNHLLVLGALQHISHEIEYDIYGPVKDMAYWQQCLLQIQQLPANIKVTYHGDVNPLEIPAILHATHVAILPSKSENFGHAIFEALSAGRPVITSEHTPWNGLKEAKAGMNVPTELPGLQKAINFFAVMDTTEYNSWSNGAAAYAINNFDVEGLKGQYREIFKVDS